MRKGHLSRFMVVMVLASLGSLHALADVKTAYQQYKAGHYAQALQLALPDARKGHPQASELVGYLYMKGQGTPQNHKLAYEYLQRAAKAGQTNAQANLGVLLLNGWGTEKNLSQAFQFFEQAAQKDNPFAQVQAAKMLLIGQGVDKDIDKGVELLKKAAEAKYPEAEVRLAVLMQQGATTEESPLQAYYLLQSAAEKDNPSAHHYLGLFYADKKNDLAQANIDKAIFHLKKAATAGVVESSLLLYHLHAGFGGAPKNPALATHWLQHFQDARLSPIDKVLRDWVGAIDHKDFKDWATLEKRLKTRSASVHVPSTHNLSLLYFYGSEQVKPDVSQAVALMKKSVQAGQLESMVLLAKWQLAGVEGTDHDPFEAQQMLETAAQTGNAEALFELGKLYFDDLGNKAKGLEYLQQAADKQHRLAQIFIQVATSIAPAIKMP